MLSESGRRYSDSKSSVSCGRCQRKAKSRQSPFRSRCHSAHLPGKEFNVRMQPMRRINPIACAHHSPEISRKDKVKARVPDATLKRVRCRGRRLKARSPRVLTGRLRNFVRLQTWVCERHRRRLQRVLRSCLTCVGLPANSVRSRACVRFVLLFIEVLVEINSCQYFTRRFSRAVTLSAPAMVFTMAGRSILALLLSLTCALQVAAQTGASASVSTPPPTSFSGNSTTPSPTTGGSATSGSAPDVYLNVPTLGVERIELSKLVHTNQFCIRVY